MTSPSDPGGVVITLRDIYQQLVGLTARVDTALSRSDHHEEQLTDHESRLRSLERQRWPLASVAVLVPLASVIVAVLVAIYGPAGK